MTAALLTAAAAFAASCQYAVTSQLKTSVRLCGRRNSGPPGSLYDHELSPGGTVTLPCPSVANGTFDSYSTYLSVRGLGKCADDMGCQNYTHTCKSYPWVLSGNVGDGGARWYGALYANYDGQVGFTGSYGAGSVNYGFGLSCTNGSAIPPAKPGPVNVGCTVSGGSPSCTPNQPQFGKFPDTGVVTCELGTLAVTLTEG
eukprot:TRINITY_DN40890_c0_g1_i1.p1 TRINITY_DN40890_c0_g1~~TRINITY_DN40890_c0_g1_i1.p1  ORF type:complete len:200 (+),score=56.17 TRINITY_DN40890_c0_g1_i1:56-655(+)